MSLKKKIRSQFGYDVTGLTDYTDENSQELYVRAVSGASTLGLIATMTGVKSSEKMKVMDDSITLQTADCSMTVDSNNTTFTDRTMTVSDMGWMKGFCNADLVGFWTQLALKPGIAGENEELPFEEAMVDFFMALQDDVVEQIIWNGDTASGDANLNKMDGFIKILGAGGTIDLNTAGDNAITDANALAVLKRLWKDVPTELRKKDDLLFLCGSEVFDSVIANMTDLNLFHYNPELLSDGLTVVQIPGTRITLRMVEGLNGSNNIYMGRASHLTFGTDLESDFEEFEIWYSKDDDKIYIRVKFRGGVQVPLLNQIGVFVPVP